MTSGALVSVIIPVYNHEKYVADTLRSIMEQTYADIELIIIDDGSTDSSFAVVQAMLPECEKRFIRVVAKTQSNAGSSETINRMLKEVHGEFVYFIASDDLAKPHAIEKEISFLSANPDYHLAVGDNELVDENGKRCYWGKKRKTVYDIKKAKFRTFAERLQKLCRFDFNTEQFGTYPQLYIGNHVPNGYLIRRSILESIPSFNKEAPLEDWFLMLQIAKYGKLKFLDEILFSYRWHSSNTVKNKDYMEHLCRRTRAYENHILETADLSQFVSPVKEVFESGVISKRQGIPYIIERITHYSTRGKSKIWKVFGINLKQATHKI